ncbi:type I-E CRISPR-associated protein Cse1/CasA, partial [Cutibacterium acnes]
MDGGARQSREVSLQQLFEEAGSFRTLSGELATQDVAVLRLCLAILQRALDDEYPERADDVPEVLERLDDEWDSTVVPAVLGYLESHASRFDLFDPFAPFFQVAGMHTTKGEFSELNKLILDMPAGKPFLTSRSATAARLITPAEAARWLVHLQAFDPSGIKTGVVGHPRANGGKVYPEGVAWTGQLGL